VQEGWQAPGCNAAPACPALAPAAAAGKLNAKLKSDFRCYQIADMLRPHRHVGFVPQTDSHRSERLFDHLIGPTKRQWFRKFSASWVIKFM
jgi:hypothetical protein